MKLFRIFLVIIGPSILFSNCEPPSKKAPPSEPEPLAIKIHEVSRGPLVPNLSFTGIIRGRKETIVLSETRGRIEEISAEIGMPIEKKAPLIRVDNTIARIQLDQAREDFKTAELNLVSAKTFLKQGSISQADLNRAQSLYKGAEARLRTAETEAENTTVRAPFSGRILSIPESISPGAFISPGTPVARIGSLTTLEVTLSAGEEEIGLIRIGDPAKLTIPAARETGSIPGKVAAIGAGASPETGAFLFKIRSENPDPSGILSGMTAKVDVNPGRSPRGLWIPESGLTSDRETDGVYLNRKGTAVFVPVVTGPRYENRIFIPEGLSPGDQVILTGLSMLSDGAPVKVAP